MLCIQNSGGIMPFYDKSNATVSLLSENTYGSCFQSSGGNIPFQAKHIATVLP